MRTVKLLAAALAAVLLSVLLVSTPATAASPTGHKKIQAVEAPGGKVLVTWGATTGVKYYNVKVSSLPDMSQDVKTYKISKKLTSATVAPAAYAGASTGNYTFVRVYAVKKNGKVGESPYKKVRLTAPAADAVNPGVTVATFNIRTAEADKSGGPKWASRKDAVAAQITASGASVVAIQEAGAKIGGEDNWVPVVYVGADGKNHKERDYYWQFEQLDDLLPNYSLVNAAEYSQGDGKESTRILYDPSKVTLTESGFFAPSKVDDNLQFVPWAVFTDNATQKQFVFISTHLANNAKGQTEKYWSKLRTKQAQKVIAFAKDKSQGRQVIVAGDMNSNMYSAPSNVVDKAFLKAGFFDAYASASVENEFFATFNEFKKPKASASRTDYIFTWGGPTGSFGYKNWIVRSGTFPSDHYMQSATVPF
jgi:endonuclease/exonuclease/phosphatase family metal-dependent hydrolase